MATIDSLDIKISSDVNNANKAIDSLVRNLRKLATSLKFDSSSLERLGNVSGNNIKKLGEGLQSFANAAKSLKDVDSSNFTKLANGIKKIASIDSSKLEALNRIDGNSFRQIGEGVKALASGLQNLQGIKKSDFNRLASGIERLASIQVGNMTAVANALKPLAEGINILSTARFDNTSLQNLINSLTRLSNANTASLANIDFEKLGNSISKLATALSRAEDVKQNTISMTNAVAKLANAGANAEAAAIALPKLGANLKTLINSMAGVNKVEADTIAFTTALAQLATAGAKTATTAANLDKLGTELIKFFNTMASAPNISQNTIQMTQALAQLANSGNSAGRMFNSFPALVQKSSFSISSLAAKIKSLIPHFGTATKSASSFLSQLTALYAKIFMLARVFQVLKKAITNATDYIEEFNYFSVAIGKIAEENKAAYKQYGYDDAETYAESFQTRLTELTAKMSGFNIDEAGELSSTGLKNLGLNVTQLTNYEARVAQITNSVGMLGEASIASSKALTMLSGDISSLANVDLATVMDNLSSGLTGQTAAVKKYGMDISVASLRQYALSLGIEKSTASMTQAEKMYLRMIAILDQSKVAWGDLANTINQPANQFRLLKNNIQSAGMMIGRLFIPIISKVLPYLNAMSMAIRDLIQWIGDLFGIKWDNSSIATQDTSGWSDLEDAADDAADAIGNAADEQKKFNKQLQGFDELNNLSSSSTDSSADKGVGSDDVSGILSDALIKAVEDYEKRWQKAFDNMTSKADELKEKIEEVFKKDWAVSDFSDVGEMLGTWIKNGLENIPWSTLQEGFEKVGTSIGTFINGFVTVEGLGDTVGKTIANGIDLGVKGLNAFYETVDWEKVGAFIASGVNGAITTDLFKDVARLIANKLNAAFQTLGGFSDELEWGKMGEAIIKSINTFFDTFNVEEAGLSVGKLASGIATTLYTAVSDKSTWKKLGTKIGDGINGFFEGMNEVNKDTKLTGWQELGKSISDSISGIAVSITEALKTVSWDTVGKSIADFIKNINWIKVGWNLVLMVGALIDALAEAIIGFTETAPLESAVVALFAGLKLTGVLGVIASTLTALLAATGLTLGKCVIGLGLAAVTFRLMDSDSEFERLVAAPITAGLAAYTFTGSVPLLLKVAAVTFVWDAGLDIGKKIGELLYGTDSDWSFSDYDISEWIDAFKEYGKDLINGLLLGAEFVLVTIPEWLKENVFNPIVDKFKELFGIHSPSTVFKELGGYLVDGLIEGIKTIGDSIKETIKVAWSTVTTWWKDNVKLPEINAPSVGDILEKIKDKWKEVSEWVSNNVIGLKAGIDTKASEIWNDFKEKCSVLWEKVISFGANIKTGAATIWNSFKENCAVLWEKIISFGADIKTGAATIWNDFKEKCSVLWEKVISFGADIKATAGTIWNKFKENCAALWDKVVTFGASVSMKASEAWKEIKEKWDTYVKNLTLKVKMGFTFAKTAMKAALNTIINWINKYIIKNLNKISITIPKIKVAGQTLFAGKTVGFNVAEIKGFETGGFPQKADLFYANENGKPELIGRMGNRTAVANNDQIVTAVSDGVFNALSPVLTLLCNSINEMNAGNGGNQDILIEIDGDNILKAVRNSNARYKKSHGVSALT